MIFRFCDCKFTFQHSDVFLFNVGNKIFCFFKKWVLLFWRRVHFKVKGGGGAWGRSQVLQRWAAHKGGRSDRFKFFLNGWSQYFSVGLIPWRKLWKGKSDTFFMSQTLILSIKLATVNSIPYLGVSTVLCFPRDICRRWCKLKLQKVAKQWTTR